MARSVLQERGLIIGGPYLVCTCPAVEPARLLARVRVNLATAKCPAQDTSQHRVCIVGLAARRLSKFVAPLEEDAAGPLVCQSRQGEVAELRLNKLNLADVVVARALGQIREISAGLKFIQDALHQPVCGRFLPRASL